MTEYKDKILEVLDVDGGYETGIVASKISPMFGCNKRQHSAFVRSVLLELERSNLVKKLDNQKPDLWCKVST